MAGGVPLVFQPSTVNGEVDSSHCKGSDRSWTVSVDVDYGRVRDDVSVRA